MDNVKDVNKETTHIKREFDSVEDFEYLGHDSSPLKEKIEPGDLLGLSQPVSHSEINKRAETVGSAITDVFDPLTNKKMDSNVFHMGDHIDKIETEPKVDKFLEEFGATSKPAADKFNIQAFLDNEKELKQDEAKIRSSNDLLDRYSDSEPEQDDFKPSKNETFPKKDELPESFGSTENVRTETFKDVKDYHFEPLKKESEKEKILDPIIHSVPQSIPGPIRQKTPEPVKEKTPEPVKEIIPEIIKEKAPEIIKEKIPEPVKEKTPEPVKEKTTEPIKKQPEPPKKTQEITQAKPKIAPADAEAIFRKMGLDTWFNPEKLNPKVESLIYWRDPKKSGPVFGGVLIILLALTYFSLITVVAYLSLIALSGTIAFRIYKNIVQAVQKTGDGHPFKNLLELDVSLPQDKVKEISEVAVAHFDAALVELRRLFLVEDLVDSIKFGVLLWTLTYLGAWFNGMTLIIIAWVALFTLPKVYETNKTQIDANLEIVRTKLAEITSKVKAAIPYGKKAEEKKEQ